MAAALFITFAIVGPVTSLVLWLTYRGFRYFKSRRAIARRMEAVGER